MTKPNLDIGHWCMLVNSGLARIYGRMRENGFPVEPVYAKPTEEFGMAAYMLMGDIPAEVAAVLLVGGDFVRGLAAKAGEP